MPDSSDMTFRRQDAPGWHREVPGARWFKADLHIHTIDDHAGGRAKLPSSLDGRPDSGETIVAYARQFLQSAIRCQVRVLGITPHSPRVGDGAETSAVWRIVEEWNEGLDDDGTPFREKIYAVFPGFEPSLNQGKAGLHLLFLFDPEIGRDHYLRAFEVVMGGVTPWRNRGLQISSESAGDSFRKLREFHGRECPVNSSGRSRWNYITLAPHIESDKGLLGAQKAQVLALFQHGEVAGLELGDEKLPDGTLKDRPWLRNGMVEHHQAFFHGSDAYSLEDIGKRHTWLKLASPKVEALRQAFIASDSRVRMAYEHDGAGNLIEAPAPDVTVNERPWLKSVTVRGNASFFGSSGDGAPDDGLGFANDLGESGQNELTECRFCLSPDLTCIIGGSMTGKSTFLDGLRMHVGADPPQDPSLKAQVEARGRKLFLAGSPEVTLECPGRDPTAPSYDQWPAVFHAQNELQRLALEPEAVEDILARLVASETRDIERREERLNALGRELQNAAKNLKKLDEDLADAEQAFERSRAAARELDAFSDAGVEALHRASFNLRSWSGAVEAEGEIAAALDRVLQSTTSFDGPPADDDLRNILQAVGIGEGKLDVYFARMDRFVDHLQTADGELKEMSAFTARIVSVLERHEQAVRVDVDRKLAARGVDGARIREFQALSRQASLLLSYEAHLDDTRKKLTAAERTFQALRDDRKRLVDEQRAAFDRVMATIREQFGGRIASCRIDYGNRKPLATFIKGLGQKGVTRWWNDLSEHRRPAPHELLEALDTDGLASVGMSGAVQNTFREAMSHAKRRELATIRCRDRYLLELTMDDGSLRRLDDLSGGQRVSVLLSLLLETNDDRPLVIDQPEDELDNRFLFETVLPALKRLKGRRQIIVATHNANIVVNGDADQVIRLEATANRGRVAQSGAIEDPAVRDAIVRTVDGGEEAFRLRRLKYGF